MPAIPTASATPPPFEPFGSRERGILIAFGVVFAAAGLLLWLFPVDHSKPAPASAKCTDAKTCFVKVDDAPELLLSSLVVLGGLLVLIGINNRKLSSFTGPSGIGFQTSAPAAADDAKKKTAEKADKKGLTDGETAAATLVAEVKAEALAHELEKVRGRPLMQDEIATVSEESAQFAVDTVKDEPAIR